MQKQISDQLRGYGTADDRLCSRSKTVYSPFFQNSKFQASQHLLWLYSRGWVGLGRKPSCDMAHT